MQKQRNTNIYVHYKDTSLQLPTVTKRCIFGAFGVFEKHLSLY